MQRWHTSLHIALRGEEPGQRNAAARRVGELAAAGPGSTTQGIQHREESPSSRRTEHTTGISTDALSDVCLSRRAL